jgi:hypothetical protein
MSFSSLEGPSMQLVSLQAGSGSAGERRRDGQESSPAAASPPKLQIALAAAA